MSAPDTADITVLILTYNEAIHIERAIDSVRRIARDIVVIDSLSTDNTVTLAKAAGARVLTHPFVNQALQFQWGLDHADIATAWTLKLDADEIIEADLAAEIAGRLPMLPADVTGVNFDRKHVFMGRWIRHGGRYPLRLLRLWRTGQGRVESRWMDEHVTVRSGRTVVMKGGFADINLNNLGFFTDKHNRYATREAIEILNRRYDLFARLHSVSHTNASRQAGLKRWIKERVYNRLPFWVGPLGYFFYRYFGQLGFLDGRPGAVYHFLQGFWYRFLVNAKIVEFEQALVDCSSKAEVIARISHLTDYDLNSAEGIELSTKEP